MSEGARNATVARLVGRLLAGYADPLVVLEVMLGWNLRTV